MSGAPGEITSGILPFALRATVASLLRSAALPAWLVALLMISSGARICPSNPSTAKGPQGPFAVDVDMARPERFELPTAWFVARYSIQLSYGRVGRRLYSSEEKIELRGE